MRKSYLIDWLGCKINNYECDAFDKIFKDKGFIKDEINPGVILINTCSVTATSDKKSRQLVSRYRKKYPNAILCVMGCSSQSTVINKSNSFNADIIIGTSDRKKIFDLIEDFDKNRNQKISINSDFRSFTYDNYPVISSCELTRAYVKIQDGCNNFCSYCLIPYVRGVSRSRNSSEIVKEINVLVEKGYKEVVLTGVDVASYGLDLEPKVTFSDLLELILNECKDLCRLRISSIEESMVDEKFIKLLKNNKTIAGHMHLSLQSGSDSVLKRMNRKYTRQEFYDKVVLLRQAREDINLTTDIIVGFPGETEENFEETYNFAIICEFSKIHVFPFSPRKGTAAYLMKDQIPAPIKKERVDRLLRLSDELTKRYEQKFIGKTYDFLIESYDEKSKSYSAKSNNYLEMKIFDDKKSYKIGEIYNIDFYSVKN